MLTPLKGNNWCGELLHLLLALQYNTKEGLLECESIKKQWMIDNLAAKPEQNKADIEKKYENINLKTFITNKVVETNSMFIKSPIAMMVIYGIMKEAFQKLNIDMKRVKEMDVIYSKNRMKVKTSVTSP